MGGLLPIPEVGACYQLRCTENPQSASIWQFEGDNGWFDCDAATSNAILGMSKAVQQLAAIHLHGFRYELDLSSGTCLDLATGQARRLRRVVVECQSEGATDTSAVNYASAMAARAETEPIRMPSVTPVAVPAVFTAMRVAPVSETAPIAPSIILPATLRRHADQELVGEQESDDHAKLFDTKSIGNERIAEILEELGAIYRIKRDFFRARGFERAVETVRTCQAPILSGRQARRLKGIGDGIARRIDAILIGGTLEELEELKRDDETIVLRELRAVHGVGAVTAAGLIENGIRSLDDLRNAAATGHIHLDAKQEIGLKYVDEFRKKIPRSEMMQHEALLQKTSADLRSRISLLVCGSYRRGKSVSGDIDILITAPDFTTSQPSVGRNLLQTFVNSLWRSQYLKDDLASGEKKYMGVCRLPGQPHRRLDVRCLSADQFHFGTLYFTGSAILNVRMRMRAMELGLVLNEYGLINRETNTHVRAASEREIFDVLKMDYLEPCAR